jgi:hypothetical protein
MVRIAFQWLLQKRTGPCLEERINTMSESFADLVHCDEETLSQELPDAALEVAAGKYWEVGNPFTIAFCTGLDTCPA